VVSGEAADSLAPLAADRGVWVERRVEPGVFIEGDPDLLRLLAANLLDNAIEHTPAGRRVVLTVEVEGAEARLRVADEGSGVAPAHRDRIFERFYRGQGAHHGVGGIGLSVVRWVAEAHGGSVRLLPSAEGAVFEVRLPHLAAGAGADAGASARSSDASVA
jgi:signal transduction histidine kinase